MIIIDFIILLLLKLFIFLTLVDSIFKNIYLILNYIYDLSHFLNFILVYQLTLKWELILHYKIILIFLLLHHQMISLTMENSL